MQTLNKHLGVILQAAVTAEGCLSETRQQCSVWFIIPTVTVPQSLHNSWEHGEFPPISNAFSQVNNTTGLPALSLAVGRAADFTPVFWSAPLSTIHKDNTQRPSSLSGNARGALVTAQPLGLLGHGFRDHHFFRVLSHFPVSTIQQCKQLQLITSFFPVKGIYSTCGMSGIRPLPHTALD